MTMWNSSDKASTSTDFRADTLSSATEFASQPWQGSSRSTPSFRYTTPQDYSVESQWSCFGSPEPPRNGFEICKFMGEASLGNFAYGADGSDVMALLSSTAYADEVYGLTAMGEMWVVRTREPSGYLADLLVSEDIGAYLEQTTYTDDIYGLPAFVHQVIQEAREEAVAARSEGGIGERKALARLEMLKKHLLMKTGGDMGAFQELDVERLVSEEEMEQVWG